MKTAMIMIVCGASLAGCASLPGGAADVAPDKSGIVILRTEGLNGAVLMDVQIDGTPMSGPTGKSYLYREVAPGNQLFERRVTYRARDDQRLCAHAEKVACSRQFLRRLVVSGGDYQRVAIQRQLALDSIQESREDRMRQRWHECTDHAAAPRRQRASRRVRLEAGARDCVQDDLARSRRDVRRAVDHP